MLGIGGGGDVVGALAVARLCELLGTPFTLGGVSWERFAVDPHPGPRSISEISGGRRIGDGAVLADPDTSTPQGVRFCEARMAGFLGEPTVIVDVSVGPRAIGAAIADAAQERECDLVIYVDVGGDVLAHGEESGLASPLCDALMLAAAVHAAERVAPLGAVIGAGCDGELSHDEVLARIAALGRAGAWLGSWGIGPALAGELEAAAREVPTEASLQVARCARGETGPASIRKGLRSVELGPVGALAFFFDPPAALELAPLATAVSEASSVDDARDALAARGVRTELDYEHSRAREGP